MTSILNYPEWKDQEDTFVDEKVEFVDHYIADFEHFAIKTVVLILYIVVQK